MIDRPEHFYRYIAEICSLPCICFCVILFSLIHDHITINTDFINAIISLDFSIDLTTLTFDFRQLSHGSLGPCDFYTSL